MQVSVESLSAVERKLMLEIPAEQIDSEVQKRVVDTAKKVRLDGFRPGKVPQKVVRQRFGESLRAEVVGEIANKSFQEAVAQESLSPVSSPAIDFVRNEAGQNLEVIATFEVFPEIDLADPATLSLEKLVSEVSDDDVDAMIEKLRDQRAAWNEVDRPAQDGAQVNIDFRGTNAEGEAFDGGTADGVDLILGSGQMIDGFEAGLVGAKAGEERSLDLTFPEEYHSAELAGAKVNFAVTINKVNEKELPAIDEEFMAAFEVEGGYDEFRDKVKDNMQTQLKDAIDNHLKQQVMDGLFEQNTFELPATTVNQQIETLREQAIARFGGNAEGFDKSLLPDEMFTEQARRMVALGLLLNKVVEKYEIKPEREQLLEFIDDIAASYDDPDEVRQMYMSNEQMLQQVNLLVVEKMVVEKITEITGVTEKVVGYDEAVASGAPQR